MFDWLMLMLSWLPQLLVWLPLLVVGGVIGWWARGYAFKRWPALAQKMNDAATEWHRQRLHKVVSPEQVQVIEAVVRSAMADQLAKLDQREKTAKEPTLTPPSS